MHRTSLVGLSLSKTATRPRNHRAHLEPLEARNLLSINDLVVSTYDNTSGNTVLAYQVELPMVSSVATPPYGGVNRHQISLVPPPPQLAACSVSASVSSPSRQSTS